MQSLNELRRRGLEALEEAVLKQYRREVLQNQREVLQCRREDPQGQREIPQDCRETPHSAVSGKRESSSGQPRIFVSLERPDCLPAVLHNPYVERIYVDAAEFGPELWKETADDAAHLSY